MPPHPLPNFEIQKCYKNEARFSGVFLRNNLPRKIKDGAYLTTLDEYADVGTRWIALFFNRNEIVYFNSFGVEHFPEEIKEFIGNKNTKANIFFKVESYVANWAQIFDKGDPGKHKYRQELTPKTEYQKCRVFVRNDLVETKIKSCRKSSKRFLEFKKC